MLTDGPMDLAQIGGGVAQAGMGAATGNPIAMIAGIAGITTSIFGGAKQADIQRQEADVSENISRDEQAINQQRQKLSQDIYYRQTTENMRQAQASRARALAAGVESGGSGQKGQQGSNIGGATAQATAEQAFNQSGLAENFQISQNIFGITNDIFSNQQRLASLGGQGATWGAVAGAGQAVAGSAMSLGRLSGGFGGSY